MRKWKATLWPEEPEDLDIIEYVELQCPSCEREALFPHAPFPEKCYLISAHGLSMIFDPPGWSPGPEIMPSIVKCPHCRREFGNEKYKDLEHVW